MKKGKEPKKLGDVMYSVLSERGYLESYFEAEVLRRWRTIVGEKIAQVTECTEIRDRILYVKVSSASWRQELSFFKDEIIEKIKSEIHHARINDIIFC